MAIGQQVEPVNTILGGQRFRAGGGLELGVCKLSVFTRLANAGLQAALA
jgi:hypothetical protein